MFSYWKTLRYLVKVKKKKKKILRKKLITLQDKSHNVLKIKSLNKKCKDVVLCEKKKCGWKKNNTTNDHNIGIWFSSIIL